MSKPGELTPERAALIADMIQTMTYSLRTGCTPAEAALVLSHVIADIVYHAVGDDAKKDADLFHALETSVRMALSKLRAERKPS